MLDSILLVAFALVTWATGVQTGGYLGAYYERKVETTYRDWQERMRKRRDGAGPHDFD